MKHRHNHGRILFCEQALEAPRIDSHAKVLQANTTETFSLEIDKELLSEIRTLSAADKEIQEIRRKKANVLEKLLGAGCMEATRVEMLVLPWE